MLTINIFATNLCNFVSRLHRISLQVPCLLKNTQLQQIMHNLLIGQEEEVQERCMFAHIKSL